MRQRLLISVAITEDLNIFCLFLTFIIDVILSFGFLTDMNMFASGINSAVNATFGAKSMLRNINDCGFPALTQAAFILSYRNDCVSLNIAFSSRK